MYPSAMAAHLVVCIFIVVAKMGNRTFRVQIRGIFFEVAVNVLSSC